MAGYPYKVSGHGDLSGIFKAYVSGTHPSNTGYKVSGVDLATLFQSSNYQGFDQISYNTNYKSINKGSGAPNGDLRYIFAYYGY